MSEHTNPPEIKIKASANKHAMFFKVTGISLLIITLIIITNYNLTMTLPVVLVLLASIVMTTLGVLKELEPEYSFILTPSGITYCHKYGQWHVQWDNIQRIDQIKQTYGIEQRTLPYIGLRLVDFENIFDTISPRLASRLVHEQRDLYIASMLENTHDRNFDLLNLSPYKRLTGKNLLGPIACWGHRTKELHQFLGFDLYLPINSFDMDSTEFMALLKECKQASTNY